MCMSNIVPCECDVKPAGVRQEAQRAARVAAHAKIDHYDPTSIQYMHTYTYTHI